MIPDGRRKLSGFGTAMITKKSNPGLPRYWEFRDYWEFPIIGNSQIGNLSLGIPKNKLGMGIYELLGIGNFRKLGIWENQNSHFFKFPIPNNSQIPNSQ